MAKSRGPRQQLLEAMRGFGYDLVHNETPLQTDLFSDDFGRSPVIYAD
jgi:hypothetical protein